MLLKPVLFWSPYIQLNFPKPSWWKKMWKTWLALMGVGGHHPTYEDLPSSRTWFWTSLVVPPAVLAHSQFTSPVFLECRSEIPPKLPLGKGRIVGLLAVTGMSGCGADKGKIIEWTPSESVLCRTLVLKNVNRCSVSWGKWFFKW